MRRADGGTGWSDPQALVRATAYGCGARLSLAHMGRGPERNPVRARPLDDWRAHGTGANAAS